ncbi:Mu transposase domain-containing protein [Desulfofustis glycolicus]|uniref:Mu transposase domain-containing protein n=1 Tax=Desulfofustis glycolicus TaxID=51195 RepID=UPI003CC56282
MFAQLNSGRTSRYQEERKFLQPLPPKPLDSCTKLYVKVGPSSTIRVKHKVYSVPSRLVGETICVRLSAEKLEVWYGQRHMETIPRLRGSDTHHIQYRHMIDWLIRKPGAFANYRYRSDLFPTSRFRMAYDALCERHTLSKAGKEYVKILQLAARENETAVDDALRVLFAWDETISVENVTAQLQSCLPVMPATQVEIAPVNRQGYDLLLRAVQEVAL